MEGTKRLGPAGAAFGGWLVLAALNQLLITTNDSQAPFGARALHRAYDAGQLAFAGVVSFGVVELARRALGRSPRLAHSRFARATALAFAAFVKGTPRQRYLKEVALVDKQLRRLLRHLDESGLSERTLLVVSADHGEAFGEHGVFNHATIVYEEVARIPLLVRGPGVVARAIDVPVSLLDVTPTILDVFGLPAPGTFMGQSLAPLLAGRTALPERPIAICSAGSLDALYVPGGSVKVIFDGNRHTVEAYDLARDPEERRNLVDTSDPEIGQSIEIAKLFFEVHAWRRRERLSD